jgi:hypothetical protein
MMARRYPIFSQSSRQVANRNSMPIQFTCPQCGKQTAVADHFGGQKGPCAACGTTVTIPAATFKPAGAVGSRSAGGTSGLLIALAILSSCLLICGGLVALILLPALQSARGSARKAISLGHVKQLAIALHSYHDANSTFPPAVVTDADGKPLYSGRVLLLPYMEQRAIYDQIDKSKAWNSPENLPITMQTIDTFLDPASTRTEKNRSDYVFVTGSGTIFDGKQAIQISAITDGTSNTLMLIETSAGPANWAAPEDWNADSGQLPPGNHAHVNLAAFADGSIRAIEQKNLQPVIKQLTVRNDGQLLPSY